VLVTFILSGGYANPDLRIIDIHSKNDIFDGKPALQELPDHERRCSTKGSDEGCNEGRETHARRRPSNQTAVSISV